ncbi:MAG: prolipoprotein diacylglyceryl transferase [candidate division KSB1 bacterium]|nr:prolipoprotein diacylglyceryl transferase [candidate division KSB1 bacterium]MDZ7275597.1 prolipoprotein diacylglyceryl transferase [candidate division KSB1 bacterium]MDZ7284712.1 prolipoprotein diacylglyceryl transferase [candidate division KSB1 bacterium]MDZ7297869.1 prolipoprotein diacylglyceryl transferase [candidate division KSB1 bacterium]MDZ7306003.1 prolipoprotein diacylglyceryl transferase [candidate division KSB1 bacterium]
MYPDLFSLGPVAIHSFGVMAMLGFLTGTLLMRSEFRRLGLDPDLAVTISTVALIGGFVGARLYYMIEHWHEFATPLGDVFWRGGLNWHGGLLGVTLPWLWRLAASKTKKSTAPLCNRQTAIFSLLLAYLGARLPVVVHYWRNVAESFATVFNGAGLVWYGGLFGGAAAVMWTIRHYNMPFWTTVDVVAVQLLVGQSFGRMGCFLSGDGDYGPPADVPWAMAFPQGVVPTTERVHPTPLYDIVLLLTAFAIIWKVRRKGFMPGTLSGLYLIAAGGERFLTEFWRRTPKIAFGWMTLAQIISLAMILAGVVLICLRREPRKV